MTGFRGTGKSTLVAKTLFDEGMALFYGLERAEKPDWGPFSKDAVHKALREPNALAGRAVLIPVHVSLSGAIEAPALMRRIIRRTYTTLARYPIGEFSPETMRRARVAYLRSLGEFSVQLDEKIVSTLGVTRSKLGELEVSYKDELTFASSLKLLSKELSVEEAEDELIELSSQISDDSERRKQGDVGERVKKTFRRGINELVERVGAFVRGGGRSVRVVYVFDELDKLAATGANNATVLDDALKVIGRLKQILTSVSTTSIVIGGVPILEEWIKEHQAHDGMLQSIFSQHIYVPQLTRKEIEAFFRDTKRIKQDEVAFTETIEVLTTDAILSGKGRWKALRRMQIEINSFDKLDGLVPHPVRQQLAANWGTGGDSLVDIDLATSIEQLASYAGELGHRDYARAIMCAALLRLASSVAWTNAAQTTAWLDEQVTAAPTIFNRAVLRRALQRLIAIVSEAVSKTTPQTK